MSFKLRTEKSSDWSNANFLKSLIYPLHVSYSGCFLQVLPFVFSLLLLADNFLTFRLAIYSFTPAAATVNHSVVIQ